MSVTSEHERTLVPVQHLAEATHLFQLRRTFGAIAAICVLFVACTTTAMLLYPGGAGPTVTSHGYQFFVNFFSDLGQTRTQSGAVNYPSMLLFGVAMIAIGGAAAGFFVTFAHFFANHPTTVWGRRFNHISKVFGLLAAIAFACVGLTPSNLVMPVHLGVASAAFDLLMAATLLQIAAIRRTPGLPTALLWVNCAFVAILIAYIGLQALGPASTTLLGDEINVTGQKVIVYSAIAAIFAQALILRWRLLRPLAAHAAAHGRVVR